MSEHIVRQTRQKDAIREALSGNDEFISAQDLHRKLEDEGVHIGLATVYRQLNALVESGSTASNCTVYAVTTGITIIWYVRHAVKPWKSTLRVKTGCAASRKSTASPSNRTPSRCSACALTVGTVDSRTGRRSIIARE